MKLYPLIWDNKTTKIVGGGGGFRTVIITFFSKLKYSNLISQTGFKQYELKGDDDHII